MSIPLVSILIYLIIIGAVLYVIKLLPIDATIKTIATVVVIVFVALWLLSMLTGVGPVLRF